jgi:hypothetical protein
VPRRPTPPVPQAPNLSAAEKRKAIERLNRRVEELKKFEPQSIQERRSPEVVQLEAAVEETLSAIFGHETSRYIRYRSAADLEPSHMPILFVTRGAAPQGENSADETHDG